MRVPSPSGLVLLDVEWKPLHVNAEAARILCYPTAPAEAMARRVTRLLHPLLRELGPAPSADRRVEFVSGRRTYLCRLIALDGAGHDAFPPRAALLLDRRPPASFPLARVAGEFRLTGRQADVVGLLMQGMTSKQIASRLGISPHTVKAVFRLLMTKLGVSTRAGILGRMFERLSPPSA